MVVAEEDIELMAEFGTVVLQRDRLARLIEEAYAKDDILDTPRLCLLFPQTRRGIRAILFNPSGSREFCSRWPG